jgi:hypothetical protein
MATPERSQHNTRTLSELISQLEDVEWQLELVGANENTIERFFQRDALLEQQDLLQEQIDGMSQ